MSYYREQGSVPGKPNGKRIHQYQPLVLVCAGFSVGILLDRWVGGWLALDWQVAVLALFIWLVCYRGKMYRWSLCSLVAAIVLLGTAWHGDYWSFYQPTEIGRLLAGTYQPICLKAVARSHAVELPAEIGEQQMREAGPEYRLELEIFAVRDGRRWRSATGRAVCSVTGSIGHIQAGDRLRLLAQGQRVPEPRNPGQFQWARYYRAQRTLTRLRGVANGVTVLESATGNSFLRFLENTRQHAREQFVRHLPRKQAALASAIIVGQRDQLSSLRREVFLLTGTLHLLVVSGFHVGIFSSGVWLLGRVGLFRRRMMLWIVIGLVTWYAVLTGGRPPVTRATTLVVVLCGARLCGRPVFTGNTIALAAIILLIRNPSCLFDPGTQLSFMAVLAIMQGINWSSDPREPDQLDQLIRRSRPWFYRLLGWMGRRAYQLIWLSVLIWSVTAPLVLHYFHVLSYASIFLNLVLYLPMVLVMFSGLGIWGLGQIPFLGQLLGWICRWNLAFIESTVEAVQQFRWSHVWGPGLPESWLVLLYGIAIVGFYCRQTRSRRWYHGPGLLLLLVAGGVAWPLTHGQWFDREEGLRCTFIAVGHGTCVLLEMPDGQNWLYDAGAMGRPGSVGRRIAALLWSRGIDQLDMVVLSHADADHYNALPHLLERFNVPVVGMHAEMSGQLAEKCPALYRAIKLADGDIHHLQSGDSWQLPAGVGIDIIHPPPHGVPGSDNANSLVMVVKYEGETILLPGDLEGSGLERLLATTPTPCSIVMAPHHGSLHSDPGRFSRWSQPEWVVISSGKKPNRGEVVAIYRSAAAEVWSTAEHGAVTICIDAGGRRLRYGQ